MEEKRTIAVGDSCKIKYLNNVEIQQNGIIRNENGYIIARLIEGIDFETAGTLGKKYRKR